jgi:hypothetical protein
MIQENENEVDKPAQTTGFLPSDGAACSLSSDTPRTARIMAKEDRGSGWLVVNRLEEHAKILEREINELRQAAGGVRQLLYELPESVLANEKKNPAWSKAELWGIERDIIPSVRALCWSAAHILPENV